MRTNSLITYHRNGEYPPKTRLLLAGQNDTRAQTAKTNMILRKTLEIKIKEIVETN